jgi:D-beta-D-heptose 7-phosphate kinase/D-beta-D-heptose 1-phosphate adenosyltransferase
MNEQITQLPKQFRILLIGDKGTDIYTYGSVDRISPEAPIPVFNPHGHTYKSGMADNVRENLEALGCDVQFIHGETSEKERLIDERSKQQIVRIDRDKKSPPITFETPIPNVYDAIVISDYNKGSITYELVEEIREEYKGPIFIDTKKTDLVRFEGCYVKINELEKRKAITLPNSKWLIVTHGERGVEYLDKVIAPKKVPLVDVTGAGDTFLSALTYKFLETEDMFQALAFANDASSITVQHVGCYAPTLKEIQ